MPCFGVASLHYGDVLQPAGKQLAVIFESEGNQRTTLSWDRLHKWRIEFSLLRAFVYGVERGSV